MIISTISRGRLVAGDEDAVGASSEVFVENHCQILARLRYQTCLASNSIAVVRHSRQEKH